MDLPSGVERRSGPWTLAVLVALLLAAGCGPAGRPRGPVIVGAREAPQLASAVHFRSWVLPLDPQRVSAPRGPMEFWEAVAAEVRRRVADIPGLETEASWRRRATRPNPSGT